MSSETSTPLLIVSRIIQCDYDENCKTIATEISSNEKITAAFSLGDSEFLLAGTSRFENLSNQLFLRYKNPNLPSDYQKSQVSMVEVELTALEIDSFPVPDGTTDTMWVYDEKFEYVTSIINNGPEPVSLADSYSEYYSSPAFGFNPFYLHASFDNILLPGQVTERRDTVTYQNFSGDGNFFKIDMGIPGAGLKFNQSEDSVIEILSPSSIRALAFTNNFTVYPNPTSDYITLDTEASISALSIYSSDGRLMTYKQGTHIDKKIAVSNYNSGIYYIIIKERGQQNLLTTKFHKI